MWRWQGLVIVLTYGAVLTGLDASSGRVRWTRPAGYPRPGVSYPPSVAVAGGAVLLAVNGR